MGTGVGHPPYNYILVVNKNTKLSKNLQRAVKAGDVQIFRAQM
jgi:hypothetical protein